MTNAGTAAAAAAGAALGARTARSCDGCMRRRARWHCPADDAFLCQACDAAVHSANPLARRHHRVRLATASSSASSSPPRVDDPDAPAWLHGLKRRPRTPRSKLMGSKHEAAAAAIASAAASVPDLDQADEESSAGLGGILGDDDGEHGLVDDDDDDLLYRVPEFDPVLAELYCNPMADEAREEQKPAASCLISSLAETTTSPEFGGASVSADQATDALSAFDVPDMELASFAADMESLLMGVDEGFDDLGFLDDEKPQVNVDHFGLDFHVPAAAAPEPAPERVDDRKRKRPEMILKLDYESVIASWARDGGSPWFHGERPRLDPGDSWPDFSMAGITGGLGGAVTAVTGGEREARVSRYREKRRTRLFAKKIRYEVRKLNAEKRPRMKGRFVKRTALPPLPRPPQTQQQQQKPPRALQPAGEVLATPQMGVHGRFRF